MSGPIIRSLIVCDEIQFDDENNYLSLLRLLVNWRARSFPAWMYAQVYCDGQVPGAGLHKIEFCLFAPGETESVTTVQTSLRFLDREERQFAAWTLATSFQFDEPGVYLFCVMVDGECAAERRFPVLPESPDEPMQPVRRTNPPPPLPTVR
jgi:hypothetical protein